MNKSDNGDRPDALDALVEANDTIEQLLTKWDGDTRSLADEDDVTVRWERGSAVKLTLEHLAVRESAKSALVSALQRRDPALAARVEGDGAVRRKLIDDLDELARGHQAINLNEPDIDRAVAAIGRMVRTEVQQERTELTPAIRELLGGDEARPLPSQRRVQMTAATHPSPRHRWYERIVPLHAVKALYDSLRTAPRGGTSPSVDPAREHTPGPRDP